MAGWANGHLDELLLAAVSLATLFLNLAGFMVLMLATIPMSIIWAYLRPILVVLRQDKVIAAHAQVYSSSCKTSWTGISKESLQDIPQFVRLALPSALMDCINTAGLFWMISFGVSAAASTRISNKLGAGCPNAAILAFKVSLFMSFVVGTLEFTLLILERNIWGRIFTKVPEIVSYVESLTPFLASLVFVDSILMGFSGVLFSTVLVFVLNIKGKGLLSGIVVALCVKVVCFLSVTIRTNWEKEANKAVIRVKGRVIQDAL
ncbi:hypothetical protein VNO78_32449 [Psophocarpus tetragonolobus]|uniref:Uncharacterized protein n=1 Tax=Psophocarpus tetragonolobus TaxID=3891 RepID=A0AAN9RQ52_PSOTE